MALTTAATAAIVNEHKRSENDTGSPEVQVALLTSRIQYLTAHLEKNKHDYHTRYGLTNLVSQRRRLLRYLKNSAPTRYQQLIKVLGLRG